MRIAVIIPSYNEEENIPRMVEEFKKIIKNVKLDVVFINDGSTDRTESVIRKCMDSYKWVRIFNREKNKGYAQTLRDGMSYAKAKKYDIIMQMDCDLTHSISLVPKMLLEIEKGYDMVIASRYAGNGGMKNIPKNRVLLSNVSNAAFRVLLGLNTRDTTSGFRCYKREVIENIDLFSNSFQILLEFTIKAERAGFRIKEVPFMLVNRRFGDSKFKLKYLFDYIPLIIRGTLRLV